MSNYKLSDLQAENNTADGFGKNRTADASGLIQIWINVRKDSQIPAFDAISETQYHIQGLEDQEADIEALMEMLNEYGGMFIDDALKLNERDVKSVLALKALKKAIIDYFRNTSQEERLRKATENIICSCRHVTDHDILEAMEKGHKTVEALQMVTGAGSGCSSCQNKVKAIISQPIKTDFGSIK